MRTCQLCLMLIVDASQYLPLILHSTHWIPILLRTQLPLKSELNQMRQTDIRQRTMTAPPLDLSSALHQSYHLTKPHG